MVAIVLIGMFNKVVTLRGGPFNVPNRPIPTGLIRRRLSRIGRIDRRRFRRVGRPYGLAGVGRHFRPEVRVVRRVVHRRRRQFRRGRRRKGRRVGRRGRPMSLPMSPVGLNMHLQSPVGPRGPPSPGLKLANAVATWLFPWGVRRTLVRCTLVWNVLNRMF